MSLLGPQSQKEWDEELIRKLTRHIVKRVGVLTDGHAKRDYLSDWQHLVAQHLLQDLTELVGIHERQEWNQYPPEQDGE